MKKLAVFVLVISVFSGAVFGQGQEFTFRGLPWGATQEQVIAVLGQPLVIIAGRLQYPNIRIAGYDAYLELSGASPIFRLQEAAYRIHLIDEEDEDIEKILLDLLAKLSVLYGVPNTDNSSSPPYWVVDRTLITLSFNRLSIRSSHVIIRYQSPEINIYGKL